MENKELEKEDFLMSFFIRKLSKNIDISSENIGIGKAVFKGVSVDDLDEEIFIELYSEIPVKMNDDIISLELLSKFWDQTMESLIFDIKSLIKERIVFLIYTIFKKNIQEKAPKGMKYVPKMEDVELDIGQEQDFFVVQINLTAELEEINEG